MQDFKKLRVWQQAHQLGIAIYSASNSVLEKDRGLVWQCRKSSFSISYNIAEGCGRHTASDQAHFFQMARGSASELECQLLFLRDLELMSLQEANTLIEKTIAVQKMLGKLIGYKRSLK